MLNPDKQSNLLIVWLIAGLSLTVMLAALSYGFFYGDFSKEGSMLISMPWGIITIIDVYIGVLFFSAWMCWREKGYVRRLLWLISFISLGNLATSIYIVKALGQARGDINLFLSGEQHKVQHV